MASASKKQYSPAQKLMLLEFIENNVDMVKQKVSNQYTSIDIRNKWLEITESLNATPGVQKTWKEWRKCWSDIKTRTKKKQSQNMKSMEKTGGGPLMEIQIDTTEEKILDLIGGKTLVKGNDIAEPGLPILEPDNSDIIVSEPAGVEYINTDDHCYAPTVNCDSQLTENAENDLEQRNINVNKVRPPSGKKTVKRKANDIKTSADVANQFGNICSKKCQIKENYYKEKLLIMRQEVVAKERIGNVLQQILEELRSKNQ